MRRRGFRILGGGSPAAGSVTGCHRRHHHLHLHLTSISPPPFPPPPAARLQQLGQHAAHRIAAGAPASVLRCLFCHCAATPPVRPPRPACPARVPLAPPTAPHLSLITPVHAEVLPVGAFPLPAYDRSRGWSSRESARFPPQLPDGVHDVKRDAFACGETTIPDKSRTSRLTHTAAANPSLQVPGRVDGDCADGGRGVDPGDARRLDALRAHPRRRRPGSLPRGSCLGLGARRARLLPGGGDGRAGVGRARRRRHAHHPGHPLPATSACCTRLHIVSARPAPPPLPAERAIAIVPNVRRTDHGTPRAQDRYSEGVLQPILSSRKPEPRSASAPARAKSPLCRGLVRRQPNIGRTTGGGRVGAAVE